MKLYELKSEQIKAGMKLIGANGTPGEIVSYDNFVVEINWQSGSKTSIPMNPSDVKQMENWATLDKVTVAE